MDDEMDDELTPAELRVPAGALAYWTAAVPFPADRWLRPEADARAACAYFVGLRDAGVPARPDPAAAALGLEAIDLATVTLYRDPELDTRVGREPELSAARGKLREAARRGRVVDRRFTKADARVVAAALNYCLNAVGLYRSGVRAVTADVSAALDYYNAVPDGGQADPGRPATAVVGLEGLERAIITLFGSHELGTLVGYQPDLSSALAKLRAVVRPAREYHAD